MKISVILLLSLFAFNIFAQDIACTTRLMKGRTDKNPGVSYCGAVDVKAFDNGMKYRRHTKFCKKFTVEFLSIKSTDESKFTFYCNKIFAKNCYVVGIKDASTRQGMGGLASHMVFSNVNSIPAVFNLGASGVGHKRGAIPGPGTIARLDLSCRAP